MADDEWASSYWITPHEARRRLEARGLERRFHWPPAVLGLMESGELPVRRSGGLLWVPVAAVDALDPATIERGRAMMRRLGKKAHNRRRAEAERRHGSTFTRGEWEAALESFGHRCAYCGSEGPLRREHFFPLEFDGPHAAGNIVPACGPCNGSKGTRDPRSWCTPDVYRRIVDFLAMRPGWPGEIDRMRVVFGRLAKALERRRATGAAPTTGNHPTGQRRPAGRVGSDRSRSSAVSNSAAATSSTGSTRSRASAAAIAPGQTMGVFS